MGETRPIPLNSSPEEHTLYVWDNFVANSRAKDILIVAHSYGGVCTMELLASRASQVISRVRCIAFTDSVHMFRHDLSPEAVQFLRTKVCNWVASDTALDTFISDNGAGVLCVSSGHKKHEWTSSSAIHSVFKYFEDHIKMQNLPSNSSSSNNNSMEDIEYDIPASAIPIGKSTLKMPKTALESLGEAMKLKEEANILYKQGELKKAIGKYKRMFLYLNGLSQRENGFVSAMQKYSKSAMPHSSEEVKQASELQKLANSNLAIAYYKLQEYKKCLDYSNAVLQSDPSNAKCLLRRGQAYIGLNELEKAHQDLSRASSMVPDDPLIKSELRRWASLNKTQENREKKLYSGLFEKMSMEIDEDEQGKSK